MITKISLRNTFNVSYVPNRTSYDNRDIKRLASDLQAESIYYDKAMRLCVMLQDIDFTKLSTWEQIEIQMDKAYKCFFARPFPAGKQYTKTRRTFSDGYLTVTIEIN